MAFLQFSKLVLSAQEVVKKLQIHALIVGEMGSNKLLKKLVLPFQRVLMMEHELDWLAKVKLDLEVELMEIYTCLLMLNHTNYLKDLMKIYFLNFQFLLVMRRLEQQLRYQQLMVGKLK